MERKLYKHPSFGMLSISRIQGNSGYLFGSEIQAMNFIELKLSTATLERDLTSDHYRGEEQLFTIKMSPNQFSELITTMNIGEGVPVTIERVMREEIEQNSTMESKKSYTQSQFKQRMDNFLVEINKNQERAKEIIKKKNLSKDDQEQLNRHMEKINQEVKLNIPFFLRCFQEVMDKVVLDAKAEIDSALLHSVVEAGIKVLGIENPPKL